KAVSTVRRAGRAVEAATGQARKLVEATAKVPRARVEAATQQARKVVEAAAKVPRARVEAATRKARRVVEAAAKVPRARVEAATKQARRAVKAAAGKIGVTPSAAGVYDAAAVSELEARQQAWEQAELARVLKKAPLRRPAFKT